MNLVLLPRRPGPLTTGHWAVLPLLLASVFGLVLTSCNVFNPAFIELLDDDGSLASIENAPGHMVITFINNAEVDERLISYLENAEGGNLILTESEKRALRPRVRLRVTVTFTDESSTTIEFIDGSANLVEQDFDAQALPDLNQNDLDNAVVRCDVTRVEVEPNADIEVFIPVTLTIWQSTEVTNPVGGEDIVFERTGEISPRFRALQVDLQDDDGNTVLQRNIGARDVAAPVDDPLCGSVVAIVMNGVLSVPFLDGVDDNPSYDIDDENTQASIGGRFEFLVTVQ